MASPRLLLGTAVTNPLSRHPAITAVAAATVDEISDGRMILGIGTGDRPLLALGKRPASLATVRSAIGAIRALWSGDHVTATDPAFELHDAHLRFGARADIPVYLSASGPKTLELAGELADGVILLVGLFPEALVWALEHLDRGAAKAGRPRPHVAVFAYGAIDDDEDAAVASARSIAAWFPQTAPVIASSQACRERRSSVSESSTQAGSSRRRRKRRACCRTSSCGRWRSPATCGRAGSTSARWRKQVPTPSTFPLGGAGCRRSRRSPGASPR